MSGTRIRLWFVRETQTARCYTKVPPERHPDEMDEIWIPKSVIEHTSKRGNEHHVTLPDWIIEKKGL